MPIRLTRVVQLCTKSCNPIRLQIGETSRTRTFLRAAYTSLSCIIYSLFVQDHPIVDDSIQNFYIPLVYTEAATIIRRIMANHFTLRCLLWCVLTMNVFGCHFRGGIFMVRPSPGERERPNLSAGCMSNAFRRRERNALPFSMVFVSASVHLLIYARTQ